MATSIVKNSASPKPNVNGWCMGFRARGLGFTVIIPCDTRYYNVAVSGTPQAYDQSTGWISLTSGNWVANDYGSYYLLIYDGAELNNVTYDAILTNLTLSVTLK